MRAGPQLQGTPPEGVDGWHNARDNIFSDGITDELIAFTGDTTNGYAGTFRVGVAL